MTDNEIARLKADLENYKKIAENQQSVSMDKEVEIKRLKAEVERLEQNLKEAHLDIKEHLAEIERLKEPQSASAVFVLSQQMERAIKEKIKSAAQNEADNLLKEMGG